MVPAEYKLFAVVLAAGSANRFGSTKQLQDFQGEALVHRAVRLAEKICGNCNILLTGHDAHKVHDACKPLAGFLVHNEQYESGIGGSLACAVRAAQQSADALLIMLADQPLITSEHLRSLADHWQASPELIIASRYAGVTGPPVIFPRRYFPELSDLSGDAGARQVIRAHLDRLTEIDFEDAAHDIDYPQDIARLE